MRESEPAASLPRSRRLPSLRCGGHAVILPGYARTAFDLGRAIGRSVGLGSPGLLTEPGYHPFHEGPTFCPFTPGAGAVLPLDPMRRSDETFAGLTAEAVTRWIGNCEARRSRCCASQPSSVARSATVLRDGSGMTPAT